MKDMINKIAFTLSKRNSKLYVKYLKRIGCKIGDNTHFHDPKNTFIDINRPNFIEIGTNCNITKGVVILAHDWSYKVLRSVYHDMPQKAGITKIGNNVFIGMNSIILMGTHIGNNVIIGAGSIVNGNIPDNVVIGGNPAKILCTLEQYHNKCINNFEKNAILYAKRIQNEELRNPTILEMAYFSVLFLDKNNENKEKYFSKLTTTGDNKEEVIEDLMKIKNKYRSFDEFLRKVEEYNE